jgi:hypothetical protein
MVVDLRVKKALMALGGALAAVVLVAIYYGYQLTRQEDTGMHIGVNTPDAQAVTRKLKILQDAQLSGKKGWVRFSEVEMNSFLHYEFNSAALSTNEPLPEVETARSFIDLTKQDVVWYSYVQRRVLGRPIQFLWERTLSISSENGRWTFPVKAMRVGDVEIPRRFWAQVDKFFEGADAKYQLRRQWIEKVPYLQLTNNELSTLPELRIYSYNLKATPQK